MLAADCVLLIPSCHAVPHHYYSQALHESQAHAAALAGEVAAARAAGGVWSPGAAAFEALEQKLAAMEQQIDKQQQRQQSRGW